MTEDLYSFKSTRMECPLRSRQYWSCLCQMPPIYLLNLMIISISAAQRDVRSISVCVCERALSIFGYFHVAHIFDIMAIGEYKVSAQNMVNQCIDCLAWVSMCEHNRSDRPRLWLLIQIEQKCAMQCIPLASIRIGAHRLEMDADEIFLLSQKKRKKKMKCAHTDEKIIIKIMISLTMRCVRCIQ